jgi:hypothetical protein
MCRCDITHFGMTHYLANGERSSTINFSNYFDLLLDRLLHCGDDVMFSSAQTVDVHEVVKLMVAT